MKILHTESSTGWGGQENRTLNECIGLAARGHQVLIAAPPGARLLERAAQAGLATVAIPMTGSVNLVAILRLAQLMRRERPDIVSTHSGRDTSLAGLAARLLRPRPRIVRTRHLILPITSRTTYDRLPDHVAAVSEAVKQELMGSGIPGHYITTVPTGVDFSRFERSAAAPVLRQELGLPEDAVLVGTVAILRKGKGHDEVLAAAAQVLREAPAQPKIHFAFAGDGPQFENLQRRIAEQGLTGRVHLLGLRRDVPQVLASLDLFVLATRREALGTSFIEAQAMGLPVIGCRTGGVPETMLEGETGLLVPVQDAPALAAAILSLTRDPARRRAMGEHAANFVRERYAVEKMVDGMETLYRRLLEGHGP
jgi:glycosyltransferase involved in cell wall biosynthesis